jgi:hypothetical protein
MDEFIEQRLHIFSVDATVTERGCHELQKAKLNAKGYPDLRITIPGLGQKHLYAARLMYMCYHRNFQIDGDVSHLCHNRICVNIHHLVNEPRSINLNRKECKRDGVCTQLHTPHCLLP